MSSETSDKKPVVSEGKTSGGDQINLRVRDADGNEVQFRIKKHTPLRKLMDAYCTRKGVDLHSYRFLFDGNRINEDDTPEKLGMEDMDSIDAMLFQQGGW
ncbi:ubiquitin-like protein Smt3 [Cyanidioschyzon merolae strain 10D]|jgi:small ubiquitin-related modifier|uniref:Ubiquitin-like protein Smt3 n=1 Tax=Cyanidioschyzon merolae (strain NIES-3377 / 10D) TaxID=280699 RepID=M1V6V9_CYAM1|nr:ubiquitin-like protein Smt3 [Cyanidioschyzon merolae strain 10D]BAM79244.1 ubiquitin-like protein Smt3 [Cyanidioschyzon merolae strain 10D]|eukprot:XP_005535530.1 ubiquitin-like protein Smt3 [Cyanidioschyzon merolae strain 10D]